MTFEDSVVKQFHATVLGGTTCMFCGRAVAGSAPGEECPGRVKPAVTKAVEPSEVPGAPDTGKKA
jgi:hypothetical protein